MKYLTFLAIVLLASCNNPRQFSNDKSDTATVDTTWNEPEKVQIDSSKIKQAQLTLKRLLPNFKKKYDKFRELTFYTHKRWNNYYPNRKCLTAEAVSTGAANLYSNYHSEDWIFHTSFTILSDQGKITSDVVKTYSEDNRTDNSGGEIWENVYYGNQNSSSTNKDIFELIKKSKGKIEIRFHGREYYDDAILSTSDKKALIETYDLAEAIALTKNDL